MATVTMQLQPQMQQLQLQLQPQHRPSLVEQGVTFPDNKDIPNNFVIKFIKHWVEIPINSRKDGQRALFNNIGKRMLPLTDTEIPFLKDLFNEALKKKYKYIFNLTTESPEYINDWKPRIDAWEAEQDREMQSQINLNFNRQLHNNLLSKNLSTQKNQAAAEVALEEPKNPNLIEEERLNAQRRALEISEAEAAARVALDDSTPPLAAALIISKFLTNVTANFKRKQASRKIVRAAKNFLGRKRGFTWKNVSKAVSNAVELGRNEAVGAYLLEEGRNATLEAHPELSGELSENLRQSFIRNKFEDAVRNILRERKLLNEAHNDALKERELTRAFLEKKRDIDSVFDDWAAYDAESKQFVEEEFMRASWAAAAVNPERSTGKKISNTAKVEARRAQPRAKRVLNVFGASGVLPQQSQFVNITDLRTTGGTFLAAAKNILNLEYEGTIGRLTSHMMLLYLVVTAVFEDLHASTNKTIDPALQEIIENFYNYSYFNAESLDNASILGFVQDGNLALNSDIAQYFQGRKVDYRIKSYILPPYYIDSMQDPDLFIQSRITTFLYKSQLNKNLNMRSFVKETKRKFDNVVVHLEDRVKDLTEETMTIRALHNSEVFVGLMREVKEVFDANSANTKAYNEQEEMDAIQKVMWWGNMFSGLAQQVNGFINKIQVGLVQRNMTDDDWQGRVERRFEKVFADPEAAAKRSEIVRALEAQEARDVQEGLSIRKAAEHNLRLADIALRARVKARFQAQQQLKGQAIARKAEAEAILADEAKRGRVKASFQAHQQLIGQAIARKAEAEAILADEAKRGRVKARFQAHQQLNLVAEQRAEAARVAEAAARRVKALEAVRGLREAEDARRAREAANDAAWDAKEDAADAAAEEAARARRNAARHEAQAEAVAARRASEDAFWNDAQRAAAAAKAAKAAADAATNAELEAIEAAFRALPRPERRRLLLERAGVEGLPLHAPAAAAPLAKNETIEGQTRPSPFDNPVRAANEAAAAGQAGIAALDANLAAGVEGARARAAAARVVAEEAAARLAALQAADQGQAASRGAPSAWDPRFNQVLKDLKNKADLVDLRVKQVNRQRDIDLALDQAREEREDICGNAGPVGALRGKVKLIGPGLGGDENQLCAVVDRKVVPNEQGAAKLAKEVLEQRARDVNELGNQIKGGQEKAIEFIEKAKRDFPNLNPVQKQEIVNQAEKIFNELDNAQHAHELLKEDLDDGIKVVKQFKDIVNPNLMRELLDLGDDDGIKRIEAMKQAEINRNQERDKLAVGGLALFAVALFAAPAVVGAFEAAAPGAGAAAAPGAGKILLEGANKAIRIRKHVQAGWRWQDISPILDGFRKGDIFRKVVMNHGGGRKTTKKHARKMRSTRKQYGGEISRKDFLKAIELIRSLDDEEQFEYFVHSTGELVAAFKADMKAI